MHSAQQLTEATITSLNARRSGNSSSTQTTPAGQTAGGRETPQPKEAVLVLVNRIFSRLEAIFPRTFSSAFATGDQVKLSKRELAMELAQWTALPTRQVIERAMSDLKRSGNTWPPTIPVLIDLLAPIPEDFGMPAVADAWAEACSHAHEPRRHRWSHEVVRLAGNAVGWWDLTHTTAQSQWPRLEKRFSREYQALVNRVMSGEDITPRHLLEHDGHRSQAELAARAGQERADRLVEDAGLPQRMTADQGLRSLRAALGRG
ncbi:replication protein P [Halomonas elongata]|uniref:replication protein P n=1 Tax=Halomonas elongata TaxID=2746 RepID=UPI00255AED6D|nr:replication protein P [Halomonas elongata]MDL4861423.1 replication protein P [Halomonas elongata]